MTITIVEQTTAERQAETKALFDAIRPLLDDGYSYMGALQHIGRVSANTKNNSYQKAWFRDLKEYGESQGYDYDTYSGKGRK